MYKKIVLSNHKSSDQSNICGWGIAKYIIRYQVGCFGHTYVTILSSFVVLMLQHSHSSARLINIIVSRS